MMASKGTVEMIVIGADTHKRSHTLAVLDEATGRALSDVTVPAAPRSFGELLRWARGIEDRVAGAVEKVVKAVNQP